MYSFNKCTFVITLYAGNSLQCRESTARDSNFITVFPSNAVQRMSPQKPNMNQPENGLILSTADKMNEVLLPAYRLDSTVTCTTVVVEGSWCSW